MSEDRRECDIDDLLCQLRVQSHLQGIHSLLGDERFKQQFPEFEGLKQTLYDRIKAQESTIRESFERCGMPVPEEYTERSPLESIGETLSTEE